MLEALPVGLVIEPVYEKDSKQYREYLDALDTAQTEVASLEDNLFFELDGVSYAIDVANDDYYGRDEENDFSLVTSLRFGDTRFLFAGDAENQRLTELIDEGDLRHDVLKVPHHGKAKKMSVPFLRAVSPRYAVITSDDENPEDGGITMFLRQLGAEVFLTRLGEVRAVTDGQSISFTQDQAEK